MVVIADNLLQLIKQSPEKINLYRQLTINTCIEAGKEIYKSGDYALMNQYYLEAAKLNPMNCETRKLLARSFQLMKNLDEAIENYMYFIKNTPEADFPTWVYFIECLYLSGEVEHAKGLAQRIIVNIEQNLPDEKLIFGIRATKLLSEDHAPSEIDDLFKPLYSIDYKTVILNHFVSPASPGSSPQNRPLYAVHPRWSRPPHQK